MPGSATRRSLYVNACVGCVRANSMVPCPEGCRVSTRFYLVCRLLHRWQAPSGCVHHSRTRAGPRRGAQVTAKKTDARSIAHLLRAEVAGQESHARHARYVAAQHLISIAGSQAPEAIDGHTVSEAVRSIEAQGFAHSTRYGIMRALRALLKRFEFLGAPHGIHALVGLGRRASPRPVVYPDGAVEALLRCSPPFLQVIILLCHDCALRAVTAVTVGAHHYDAQKQMLGVITKGHRSVHIPVSGRLAALLRSAPRGAGSFATRLRGQPVSYSTAYRALRHALEAAQLPLDYTFHDLRRTMAEKAYSVTHDLRVVQTLLGHDALYSTAYYLQRPFETQHAPLAAAIAEVTDAER